MAKRHLDLEMYAVFDPRVTLLEDLRAGQWPVPTSLPAAKRNRATPTEEESDQVQRRDWRPWAVGVAGFVALGTVAAGLLAMGFERGLF